MGASHGCRIRLVVIVFTASVAACSEPPPPDYAFFDACDPRTPPDATCYAERRDPASADVVLALEIAHRYIDEHPPESLRWDWGEGVLMYAMTELARVTGDAGVKAYYAAWMDHHLEEGYSLGVSDSCPPALTAIARYVETGDDRYAAVARDVMHYLDEVALRTDEGGISHLGTLRIRTLWIDSLFMFGMVLDRWAEVSGDDHALDEMGTQLRIFARLLERPDGFFLHSYQWPEAHDDVPWARGNSWVTVAGADYLRVRALRHQGDDLGVVVARQALAVVGAQDAATGKWHTVLDRSETYLETSATGLFAYGLARGFRYGVFGDDTLDTIRRAVAGVRSSVVRDGDGRPVVTGISGPTIVGTFDDYARVPVVDDLHYGVGAAILALIEASGLP